MDYLFLPFELLYRINQVNTDPFNLKKLDKGKKYAKKCHCIVGTLLRDAEDSYSYGIKTIEKLSRIFRSVDIFILENDSKDNTRKLYEEYAKKCPSNVKIFIDSPNLKNKSVDKINKYLKYKTKSHEINKTRIKKMVILRNNLLDNIKKHENLEKKEDENKKDEKREDVKKRKENTYVFITDLDIKGSLSKKGIYDTFYHFYKSEKSKKSNHTKGIDAIGVNGLKCNIFYFDDYAYKNCENQEKQIHNGITVPINEGLFPVKSTFSGGVFYKYESIMKSKYEYREKNGKIICEHVTLNQKLPYIYINTNMIYNIFEN